MGSKAQIGAMISVADVPALEVSDIQATVLRPRPSPYKGEYVILRVDDRAQGREMLRRLIPHVAPADDWWVPTLPGWLGLAFTYQGLKALGYLRHLWKPSPRNSAQAWQRGPPF